MPKGRTAGALNITHYKYSLLLPNGDIKLFTTQTELMQILDVNRSKLSRIINHPEIMQNCDIVCKKLQPALPVFKKVPRGNSFKYQHIVYDSKGNDVETKIQQETRFSSDDEP